MTGKVKAMAQDTVERREELAYRRGESDYYYFRDPKPHIWLDGIGRDVVNKEEMTEGEIEAYYLGYEEETDRKEWG